MFGDGADADSREGFVRGDLGRAVLTDTQTLGMGFCCCSVLCSVALSMFWPGMKGGMILVMLC